MSEPLNNQNFERNITRQDFRQLLDNSVFNTRQKDSLVSIFSMLAQGDGELSESEWENFINEIDRNGDRQLTDREFSSALQNRNNAAYSLKRDFGCSKEDFINFYNAVKRFIENKFSAESRNEDGSQNVFYAPVNPKREKPVNGGSFDGNWLMADGYGSSTYEEWLANNGYEFNTELGNKFYKNTAKYDYNHGYCAQSVRQGMQDTTAIASSAMIFEVISPEDYDNLSDKERDKALRLLTKFENGNPGSAYQYAEVLSMNPYFRELPHNIVETTDLTKLPKGCIVVYDAGYKDDGAHPHGHIAVTDGNGMDSGGGHYLMRNEIKKQATHIRVFIPVIDKNKNTIPGLPMIKPTSIS